MTLKGSVAEFCVLQRSLFVAFRNRYQIFSMTSTKNSVSLWDIRAYP